MNGWISAINKRFSLSFLPFALFSPTKSIQNRKSLKNTTSEADIIIRSGSLHKQGVRVKNWKKRFFVINRGVMSYYLSEQVPLFFCYLFLLLLLLF